MTEAPETRAVLRRPPRIVIVPPPEEDLEAPWFRLVTLLLWCAGGCAGLFASGWVALAALLGGVAVQIVRGWVHARFLVRRAELLRHVSAVTTDETAMTLSRAWGTARRALRPKEVAELLAATGRPDDRACIVHLGWPRREPWPLVQDSRFEPCIFTATDLMWRRWVGGLAAAAWVALWVSWGIWKGFLATAMFSPAWVWIVVVAAAALRLAWRALIRPTYLRLAPAIVQVIRYPTIGQQPTIHSYPMTGGTVVVLYLQQRRRLAFLRDGHEETVTVDDTRRPEQVMLQFWEALLTTAPITVLSESELVG